MVARGPNPARGTLKKNLRPDTDKRKIYKPNDKPHVPVKWPPYFGQILHPALPPFSIQLQMTLFFPENLNINLKKPFCILVKTIWPLQEINWKPLH